MNQSVRRAARSIGSGLKMVMALAVAMVLSSALWPSQYRVMAQGGGPASITAVLGTAFTYQGRLVDDGTPVDDQCDFRFTLYDAESGGSTVSGPLTISSVTVSDGWFAAQLDFGAGVMTGSALWMGVEVQCTADVSFVPLTGRVPLTASPYATYAANAPWDGLSGVPAGFADGADDNTTYTPGDGLDMAGTTFSVDVTDILGTGLSESSNNIQIATAYRLPSCSSGQIAEWGSTSWVCGEDDAGGTSWSLTGNGGTIPGTNYLGTTDEVSLTLAVSGTSALRLEPNGTSPNLVGGYNGNGVYDGAVGATIGGGGHSDSVNEVYDNYGTVGGGSANQAGNTGGNPNAVPYATVGGGLQNTASGYASTVSGGESNTASGYASAVPGGELNTAQAQYSFAAGYRAHAYHDGAFVWADRTDVDFASTADDQFAVRAYGGAVFQLDTSTFSVYGDSVDLFADVEINGTLNGGTPWTSASDGATSGLDADLLDGEHGSYYRAWGNLTGVPTGLNDGDNDTTYTPGDGLDLTGTTFSVDVTDILGTGLSESSNNIQIATAYRLPACSSGQIAVWNGSAWTCGTAWSLTGNSGTNPTSNFIGTTDNQALELRVNNSRVLRLEPDIYSPNIVGGLNSNSVVDGSFAATYGAVIAGGGAPLLSNHVRDHYGVIGGGYGNVAGDYSDYPDDATAATIGGGGWNAARASLATIGGGYHNTADGDYATIAGGRYNVATASNATVGGGFTNTVTAEYGTVSGGISNTVSALRGTVGGGYDNVAGGNYGTVAGGESNIAAGSHALVGGGHNNIAGTDYSFVGGGLNNQAITDTGTTVAGGYSNIAGGWAAAVVGGYGNIASEDSSFVGGGYENIASAKEAFVGGGIGNQATVDRSTVAGGWYNTAEANAATVGGGAGNSASGSYSTVPGGNDNTAAGNFSLAAGNHASATHKGAFVWADSTAEEFASTADDQFAVRANGGVVFETGSADVQVNGNTVWHAGSTVITQTSTGDTTYITSTCINYSGGAITVVTTGSGYVVVEANVRVQLFHTTGTEDELVLAIGTNPTDCGVSVDQVRYDIPAEYPTVTDPIDRTFTVRSMIYISGAGSHTYYLNGQMASGDTTPGDRFWFARMHAIFYPD